LDFKNPEFLKNTDFWGKFKETSVVFGLKMRVGGLVWGDRVKQVRKKVKKIEKNREKWVRF